VVGEVLSIEGVSHEVAEGRGGAGRGGGDVESDSDRDKPEVVVLEDTKMSGAESSGDESRSRSSFGGSSSSSCHSRVNRKRAAEDSPERVHGRSLRQPFPGAISRGAGGCRLYVLINTITTNKGAMSANPEVEIITSAKGMVANILAVKPPGPTAEATPSVIASVPVRTSSEPSVPVGEIIDGRSLISATRPTDVSNMAGNTDPTDGIPRTRTLDTTIAARDARGNITIMPSRTRASTTPFVSVSTMVNIPARLPAGANTCALASVNLRAPIDEDTPIAMDVAATNESNAVPTVAANTNEWGRQGFIIAEIHRILATIKPRWGSLHVFEAASRRFPDVDPTALQMTVLAVLMTQRQCVRELTLAGARKRPRRNENGDVFIELDLVYANRFSDSY